MMLECSSCELLARTAFKHHEDKGHTIFNVISALPLICIVPLFETFFRLEESLNLYDSETIKLLNTKMWWHFFSAYVEYSNASKHYASLEGLTLMTPVHVNVFKTTRKPQILMILATCRPLKVTLNIDIFTLYMLPRKYVQSKFIPYCIKVSNFGNPRIFCCCKSAKMYTIKNIYVYNDAFNPTTWRRGSPWCWWWRSQSCVWRRCG